MKKSIFALCFIATTSLFARVSLDNGHLNFHCIQAQEACQERCDTTPACIHNGSKRCMECYEQCNKALNACKHYQNQCAPAFQKCIAYAHHDQRVIQECRKEYIECKRGN